MNKSIFSRERLAEIVQKLPDARVCVLGDLCLDMYLYADMKKSVLSRETPHYPLPVVREVCSPGGGGNVCGNVWALGAQLFPVSVIGNDWRGYLLKKAFAERGISVSGIIESESFLTPAYVKPIRMGISDVMYEDPRLDFENRAPLSEKDENALLDALYSAAEKVNVIAVADQMDCGVITDKVRGALFALSKTKTVLVDSRSKLKMYLKGGILLKPNEVEAARAAGETPAPNEDFMTFYTRVGEKLAAENHAPVIMTLGDKGAMWCENGAPEYVSTVKAEPPIDIVGCGDTFLSALCCMISVGIRGKEALAFANLASAVTVKKIGTTGTASADEILQKWEALYA